MSKGFGRLVVFGLVSTGGAAFDFLCVLGLSALGVPVALSLLIAMVVSASTIYVIHQKLTFSDLSGPALRWQRLVAFLLNTGLVYLFRLGIFAGLLALGIAGPVALAAALVSSLVMNYAVSRILIFAGRAGPGLFGGSS